MSAAVSIAVARRGLVIALGAAMLLVACSSVSSSPSTFIEPGASRIATSGQAPPPMEPDVLTPTSKPPTLKVPGSIDATGSTDVSGQLQSVIDKAPNGSTIVFKAGGTYRLDRALVHQRPAQPHPRGQRGPARPATHA